jgi:hypothetical protein
MMRNLMISIATAGLLVAVAALLRVNAALGVRRP